MPDVDLSEFLTPKRCKIGLLELSDEQRDKLEAACAADPDLISTKRIAGVLKDWGFPVSDTTLGYHRRKECICD